MITGHSPFAGETKSDVLAAILKTDPSPLSLYAPEAPPALERVIKQCLAKNCEDRYPTMKDLLLDLKDFQSEMTAYGEMKAPKFIFDQNRTSERHPTRNTLRK